MAGPLRGVALRRQASLYIAVDEDPAGQSLRQELTRRIGVERCRIVHFGEGCKDANEHLVKYGAESLRICIEQAEEVPLEGIFTAEDCRDDLRSLYENGIPGRVPTPAGTTSTNTAPSSPAACW